MIKEFDLQEIFNKTGLDNVFNKPLIVEEIENLTYPIKKEVWDNWFSFAFLAFKKINLENIKSLALIGTGPGVDAIGGLAVFKNLEKLIITDINQEILDIAKKNIQKFTNIEVIALKGSLCQPLKYNNIKVDLIYENLPNIPDTNTIVKNYKASSTFDPSKTFKGNINSSFNDLYKELKKYLLESHFGTLIEAKESLNEGGSLICSIGGRVPYDLIKKMIESVGYKFEDLISGFKLQTEPWEVLPGYSDAEKIHNVKFTFYKYKESIKLLEKENLENPFVKWTGDKLKDFLSENRLNISSIDADNIYNKLKSSNHDPYCNFGHVIHMFRVIK